MKYMVLLLVSLFVVLNADEIAVVKTVKGEVVAKSSSGVVKLKEGSVLSASSIVITKSNALVVIIFKDNSVLNLGENTVLNLQKYVFKPTKKDYAFNLFLKKGSLIFESGKIGELAPEDFQLKTPQGIVAIRGTKFAVRVK
ncbi:FecR domain-containing protein [Sulfurimonas sp.]|uniref:FecR family protein n=1 Tax=Sulfurimonas sp. TaxID=2022749 RepID=UPI00260D10B2|nr:FecR domain-containing protein [Sulfurimonas sp.]